MTRTRRIITVLSVAVTACFSTGALAEPVPGTQMVNVDLPAITPTVAISLIERGQVRSIDVTNVGQGASIVLSLKDNTQAVSTLPADGWVGKAADAAIAKRVPWNERTPPVTAPEAGAAANSSGSSFSLSQWLQTWGGLILMAALVIAVLLTIRMVGGSRFSKRKTKPVVSTTTFDDVAGIDEIRDEVSEISDFLRDPTRYQAMGAVLPKGIVLYGPPGTGKTLLAKAVAGEAGVPFFSASGSEFVEVYVGVGARRIRDLFDAARKAAPALLYIDEIDAIGERRSGGGGGGEREHTATLDQLLTEIDGFDLDPTRPVVVLASTNRIEHLDPALVRSGRFDRKIAVGLPDREARARILDVHMRTRPLAPGVELANVAAFTAGMAGADLAALCNEASFEATRARRDAIDLGDFRRALMRLVAGPEKRTQVISEPERRVVAYHEMGHAIVGHMLPNCESVDRVTVIPQGQALGVTWSLPTEDRFLVTRQEHLDHLAHIMGGRAAEELIFGEMTSGAATDLQQATALARMMVQDLGMARSSTEESLAVGLTGGSRGPDGEERVEREIQEILASAFRAAYELLEENEDLLHRSATALLTAEALDRREIEQLLGARETVERFVPKRRRSNPFPRFSRSFGEFREADDTAAARSPQDPSRDEVAARRPDNG